MVSFSFCRLMPTWSKSVFCAPILTLTKLAYRQRDDKRELSRDAMLCHLSLFTPVKQRTRSGNRKGDEAFTLRCCKQQLKDSWDSPNIWFREHLEVINFYVCLVAKAAERKRKTGFKRDIRFILNSHSAKFAERGTIAVWKEESLMHRIKHNQRSDLCMRSLLALLIGFLINFMFSLIVRTRLFHNASLMDS